MAVEQWNAEEKRKRKWARAAGSAVDRATRMIAQWERAEIGRLGGNVSTINHQLKGIPPFTEKFLPKVGGKRKKRWSDDGVSGAKTFLKKAMHAGIVYIVYGV